LTSDANRNSWLLFALLAAQFAPAYMFSGVAVALPDLSHALHPSARELGLVETLFLAGSTSALLPLGRIADATDRRTIFKWGLFLFALTSALIPLMCWVPGLLALRFLQGMVSAALTTSGPAIMGELVPPERRGRVFGAAIGVTYAGLSAGPLCAGYLIRLGGWEAVFWGGALMLLVFAAITQAMMPSSWKTPAASPVHWPSALLLMLGVISVVLGASFWSEGAAAISLLLVGWLLLAVFLRWQRALHQPVFDWKALQGNPVLKAALSVQLLLYLNAYANIVLISLYLQVVMQKSSIVAGQMIAVGSALMASIAPLSGVLADRWKPRRVAGIGVAAIVVMSFMGASLDGTESNGFIMGLLIAHGIGFALFSTPNMTIAMGSVPASAMGSTSALSAKSRALGMIGGMLLVAAVFTSTFGSDPVQQHPAELDEAASRIYSVLCGSSLLALLLALWNGQRGR
jgi:MFS family permease